MFGEWMYHSRSERNVTNNDLSAVARATKEKFTDLIENKIKKLKSVKVSLGLYKLQKCFPKVCEIIVGACRVM